MTEIIDPKPGDRILVSRTDRLGDLVLALPFVETLKKRYPECEVDVLSSLYASPILENNPAISKIIRVQNDQLKCSKLYRKDFLHRLKMNSYRVVVALYPERQICRLFHKAGIPDRVGTMGRFHSVFFNHHLRHSRKSNTKHECEYNLDFMKFFAAGATCLTPRVYPTEKDLKNADRILAEAGVHGRFVALHPCSGGSSDRWPLEKFRDLAERLNDENVTVVLTGSADERPVLEATFGSIRNRAANIAGETDLRALVAVLSMADTLVANSTGPLHLAVAVGTKVVGLYPGKRKMSPTRWGPLGEGHQVLQPVAPDSSGESDSKSGMETIAVGKVKQTVLRVYDTKNRRES